MGDPLTWNLSYTFVFSELWIILGDGWRILWWWGVWYPTFGSDHLFRLDRHGLHFISYYPYL